MGVLRHRDTKRKASLPRHFSKKNVLDTLLNSGYIINVVNLLRDVNVTKRKTGA